MNFPLNNIPTRTQKPRQYGLTMVMDKGMGTYNGDGQGHGAGRNP
jgi:phosphosulfolactate synthase